MHAIINFFFNRPRKIKVSQRTSAPPPEKQIKFVTSSLKALMRSAINVLGGRTRGLPTCNGKNPYFF
jgi:hypothetical protein